MAELLQNEYGYVYGIQSLDLIKVGVAKNLKKRLNDMRLHNPHGCKVVFHKRVYAPYSLEKRLHALLADKAIGREWFRISLAELRAAAAVAKAQYEQLARCSEIREIGTRVTHPKLSRSEINGLSA